MEKSKKSKTREGFFMKRISPDEFKDMTYQILVSFAKVCEEYDLKYFLDYGTLIGAIRHGDFIPWDDDIDVSMPREDYDKLGELARSNPELFGSYYRLDTGKERLTYKPFYNVVDIRTITHSEQRNRNHYYPVWIDIFPMDYFTDAQDVQRRMDLVQKEVYKIWLIGGIDPTGLRGKITNKLKRIQYTLQLEKICDNITRLCMAEKNADGKLIDIVGLESVEDYVYMSDFTNYRLWKFRDSEFRIPEKYDERLRRIYGDYMHLPPEEERIPHVVAAYWK